MFCNPLRAFIFEQIVDDNLDFYIIQEGLTELCKRMCIGIKKLNGRIYLNSYLSNVYEKNNKYICNINKKDKTYDSIILCCGKDTLL